jgi:hypothetical protein
MRHVNADCIAYGSPDCIAHVMANCIADVSTIGPSHANATCPDATVCNTTVFWHQRLLFHELGTIPF